MLVAIIVSAQWIIRRLEVPQRFGTTMGLIPIGLLLPGEIAGILCEGELCGSIWWVS